MPTAKHVGDKRVWTSRTETSEAITTANLKPGAATAFGELANRMIVQHVDTWPDASTQEPELFETLEGHLETKAVPHTGVCGLGGAECRKWISFKLPEGSGTEHFPVVTVDCETAQFDTRSAARADAARCDDHHQATIADIENYFLSSSDKLDEADALIARGRLDMQRGQEILDKAL